MKQISVIQTIGNITKFEHLSMVEKNILPNTVVLRNSNPFPDYVYNVNEEGYPVIKMASIFIMLQYKYAPEKILKISSLIQQQLQLECDAGYGEITVRENIYPCIRIKRLRDISDVYKLQEFLKSFGFKLMRYQHINDNGKIKVYKTFKLLEIDEDIYRDYYEREKFYIKSLVDFDWETFNHVNRNIKLRLLNNNYDAAIGEIYRLYGHEKVIRIFDKNKSLERALELKKLFNEEMKKEMIHFT